MTKYILHGGAAKRPTEANKKFFAEVTKSLLNPVNLLIVCFAKDKNIWDEVFTNIQVTFSAASPDQQIKFTLASDDTKLLTEQIKTTDAIYMLGGNTKMLRDYLAKVENLENLWQDKIVAGTSAGALTLASYWYENDDDSYNQGLGIFPFKLFCHYDAEKSEQLEKLKTYGDNSEVKTIAEEEFFIIEK
ncbi:type 1 glutamine amidotransferase-like domain-containing protein [Candidatus Parcubacteria bacterium]|jgi:peptidase E|nr:type 1 glutamine amidotransferase-like domain-containing protein [Candidatus Parcubacteria bacterium]